MLRRSESQKKHLLRRDIKSGKVSSEKDDRGRRRIDTAELARVYGQLRQSTVSIDTQMTAVDTPKTSLVNANDSPDTPSDNPKVTTLLENQVRDLKTQLEKAEQRENTLISERSKLLDLLSAEKEEKRALMPPPEEKNKESKGWLLKLIGAR